MSYPFAKNPQSTEFRQKGTVFRANQRKCDAAIQYLLPAARG
jgi:hypothetical protein